MEKTESQGEIFMERNTDRLPSNKFIAWFLGSVLLVVGFLGLMFIANSNHEELVATKATSEARIHELESTVAALQETGPFGTEFKIALPQGKVALAGKIFSAMDVKGMYYMHFVPQPTGPAKEIVYRLEFSSKADMQPRMVEVMTRLKK